jgi:tetratricopeptide (TPR) repeat protein
MELTIEQTLQQGVAAHKEGKLEEAERLYRAILQSQPAHPDANHNLGFIAISVNQSAAALPLFKTALEANPKIEQFWLSYIDALIKEKQFENARQALEKALSLRDDHAPTYYELGLVLLAESEVIKAEDLLNKAVTDEPDNDVYLLALADTQVMKNDRRKWLWRHPVRRLRWLVLLLAGFSWFLAATGVFVRDIGYVVAILTTMLMFLSPIFYPASAVPEAYRSVLQLNPLAFIIAESRKVLLWGQTPDWMGLAAYGAVSLLIAWLGLIWFQKTRRGFADVL